jgi:hypothetical protein
LSSRLETPQLRIADPNTLSFLAPFITSKKNHFLQVPQTCSDPSLNEIIFKIPAPEQVDGMRFLERKY